MPLSFPSFSTQWEHLPCVLTGTEISLHTLRAGRVTDSYTMPLCLPRGEGTAGQMNKQMRASG